MGMFSRKIDQKVGSEGSSPPPAGRGFPAIPSKAIFYGVGSILGLILIVGLCVELVSNVEQGTYEVKQSWIDGSVSAKMNPGYWIKLGRITVWPKAETYYFTRGRDSRFDADVDRSIKVQFNEGSDCHISGTCRITLPTLDDKAVALATVYGYRSWEDVLYKLIQPQVRKALILTANLMTARESYSEKRTDFINLTADQLINGLCAYDEVQRDVEDPSTGKMVKRSIKIIKRDNEGRIVREPSPFAPLGIVVDNFEVRGFHYSDKVLEQISKQQQAYMDVQTSIANAHKAEQDKITSEAEGKAKVAQAKYGEEVVKIQAVVKAQKDQEVAEILAKKDKQVAQIAAQRDLDVATLNGKAADQRKLAAILEAEGEAQARKLKMEADNYQALKIDAAVKIHDAWAKAYASRRVPLITGAEEGPDKGDRSNAFGGQKSIVDLLILKSLGVSLNLEDSLSPPHPAPRVQDGKR
jgi:regulator of protease activity HflC (stomatin/prohibitin superfamily)